MNIPIIKVGNVTLPTDYKDLTEAEYNFLRQYFIEILNNYYGYTKRNSR